MSYKVLAKTALLIYLAVFILDGRVNAQDSSLGHLADIPELGELRGITSFHDDKRNFLGVWYWVKQTNQALSGNNLLVIFERKESKFNAIFRYEGSAAGGSWERLLPLYPGRLTGLIISGSEISSDDDQWLIALINGSFKMVHHGNGTSEFLDINDDGFPEIFDSMWPDGDGDPDTTTVYIWNGNAYRSLMTVNYRSRLGTSVRNAVDKATRRLKANATR